MFAFDSSNEKSYSSFKKGYLRYLKNNANIHIKTPILTTIKPV